MYQEEMIYYKGVLAHDENMLANISYINNIDTFFKTTEQLERIDRPDSPSPIEKIDENLVDDDSDIDPMNDYIIFGIRK